MVKVRETLGFSHRQSRIPAQSGTRKNIQSQQVVVKTSKKLDTKQFQANFNVEAALEEINVKFQLKRFPVIISVIR